MNPETRNYVAANVPGWIVAAVAAWAAVEWLEVSAWIAAAAAGAWVLKDILLFPFMRHYYRPDPADRRIIGERGVVVRPLNPRGMVRIRGELWQAQAEQLMQEGDAVRVYDISGLVVSVERDAPDP
jgi:membrane protein implicated in regulation of membrane protease activity